MSNDKGAEQSGPPPLPVRDLQGRSQGPGQLQRQHRCRAGSRGVRRRGRAGPAPATRQDLSGARPRDPGVRRDGCAGRRWRPGRDGCGHRRRPPRRRRAAGRALQSPGRALHRRPRHLDRPHDRLVGAAHHPWARRGADGSSAEGGDPRPQTAGMGDQGRRHGSLLGAADLGVPRHRHLVADGRSGGAQDLVPADGGRGQGASSAARLGHRADPGGQCRQGRHLREQGGAPRRPRQGGGRHDRRCRPDRPHARLLRIRHR